MALTTGTKIALVGVGIASTVVMGGVIYYLLTKPTPPECDEGETKCVDNEKYLCQNGKLEDTGLSCETIPTCPPESPKWVESLQECMYGYCNICSLWFKTKQEYDYHKLVYHPIPSSKLVEWTGDSSNVFIDANEIGENAPVYVSMLYLDIKFDTQPDSRPFYCFATGAPSKAQFWVNIDGEQVYNTGALNCPNEWVFNPVTIMLNKVINNGIAIGSDWGKCSWECPDTIAKFREIKVTAYRGVI